MRDYILLYINGKRHKIGVNEAKRNLSSYLRKTLNMKGTKIVCSEGDCGACTVLMYRYKSQNKSFVSINSCIAPLYLLDCCHIITVEGVEEEKELHQIQKALAKHHGTQCGFCTPGFVNSFVFMCDELKTKNRNVDIQQIKNYTTGNLCRCTGYKGIFEAGLSLDLNNYKTFFKRYHTPIIEEAFKEVYKDEVKLKDERKELIILKDIKKASLLKKQGYTVISGGTDISVFVNKGFNKADKFVSLTNIEELYQIKQNKEYLEIGSRVSLSQVEKASKDSFPTFNKTLKIFASPQIKNIGTLIGNAANGSPIGDSIPFLYVSDSIFVLSSIENQREVRANDFYLGYKQFDLKDDEIITKIKIPKSDRNYQFYKVSARKDLDISAVSLAIGYKIEKSIIKDISLAFGGVAATVYKAIDVEKLLLNKEFSKENFLNATKIIPSLLSPFSDHRGSSEYRIKLCQNLLMKFYNEISLKGGAK